MKPKLVQCIMTVQLQFLTIKAMHTDNEMELFKALYEFFTRDDLSAMYNSSGIVLLYALDAVLSK